MFLARLSAGSPRSSQRFRLLVGNAHLEAASIDGDRSRRVKQGGLRAASLRLHNRVRRCCGTLRKIRGCFYRKRWEAAMNSARGSGVPCVKCGGDTEFAAQISRLGNTPGSQIFRCAACDALTWITLPVQSAIAARAAAAQPCH